MRQFGEDRRLIQRPVGAKGAVERRNGDRPSAEDVEDRIEDHGGPQ
jgi:hypothetical protein